MTATGFFFFSIMARVAAGLSPTDMDAFFRGEQQLHRRVGICDGRGLDKPMYEGIALVRLKVVQGV